MSTATTSATPEAIAEAATRLQEAAARRTPCAPIRDLVDEHDLDAAYAIQQRIVRDREAAGAAIVGRKIGLTSRAVQDQLGVHTPDFGWLFDDMVYPDGGEVPMARLLQPKAEAEVAFMLRADLADGDLDVDQVSEAVDYAVAALEIVDSRVAGWDIRFADTVADNASSGLYVLGSRPRTLAEVRPVDVEMAMTIDGEIVSTGTGAACLGDPMKALAWLAQRAREYGEPLRAGQVVLSGALGPMVDVRAGQTVVAEISGLGSVTARFA